MSQSCATRRWTWRHDGTVRLATGTTLPADAVVLAPGNFRPATPRGIDPAALGALWADDPWAPAVTEGLDGGDTILLLGTGLTAVDVALTLEATGYRGRIVALSRRGLAPRSHGPREPMVAPSEELADELHGDAPPGAGAQRRGGLAKRGARTAQRHRHSFGAMRAWKSAAASSVTCAHGGMCTGTSSPRRSAPESRRCRPMRGSASRPGRSSQPRPRTARRSCASGRGAARRWRLCAWRGSSIARGRKSISSAPASRCSHALLAAGQVRPDPLRVGLDVDPDCRVLSSDGEPSAILSAIGPITRGAFWESVAVPDIRAQAERVAARLTA